MSKPWETRNFGHGTQHPGKPRRRWWQRRLKLKSQRGSQRIVLWPCIRMSSVSYWAVCCCFYWNCTGRPHRHHHHHRRPSWPTGRQAVSPVWWIGNYDANFSPSAQQSTRTHGNRIVTKIEYCPAATECIGSMSWWSTTVTRTARDGEDAWNAPGLNRAVFVASISFKRSCCCCSAHVGGKWSRFQSNPKEKENAKLPLTAAPNQLKMWHSREGSDGQGWWREAGGYRRLLAFFFAAVTTTASGTSLPLLPRANARCEWPLNDFT